MVKRLPARLGAALLVAATVLGAAGVVRSDDAALLDLKSKLAAQFPDVPLETLRHSRALPGWYELELGMRMLYVSADGKRLVAGEVIDLESQANLTQAWRRGKALALIEAVGEDNMIVLGAADARHTVTVFTDVDCPYCARLHRDVPALNRAGVKVRYLLYPRAGVGSRTYRRSVAVWCADDRAQAVGAAKAGQPLDMKTCDNPVAGHYELGRRLEIRGTPTIFLDDGSVIGGYVPPERLLAMLNGADGAGAPDAR